MTPHAVRRRLRLRPALAAAGLLATISLGGCSTSVTVDQADLEEQISQQLSSGGEGVDGDVSCPGDLDGTVGQTMSCDASTSDGDEARIDVEVTDVDGTDVGFDLSVVPLITPEFVEEQVTTELTAQVGQAPDDVSCPDQLDGTVGASTTCVLSAGGDTIDVDVTVSSVDGTDVGLDIEVADAVN